MVEVAKESRKVIVTRYTTSGRNLIEGTLLALWMNETI